MRLKAFHVMGSYDDLSKRFEKRINEVSSLLYA